MKLVNEAKVGVSRSSRRHGEDFEVEHEFVERDHSLKPCLESRGSSISAQGVTRPTRESGR